MTIRSTSQKARQKAAGAQSPVVPKFVFEFLGFLDGWYALRADMTRQSDHGPLDALEIENEIGEWLIGQRITPGKLSHMGNGNTGDGPWVPAVHDGSGLCVLFKHVPDVIRFEMRFPCRGITPETILAAITTQAKVVRFGPSEIAQVAYAAYQKLDMLNDRAEAPWEDISDQQVFVARVQTQMEHPDWTAEQIHDFWMRDRLTNGWKLGPVLDERRKTHPLLVPFGRLSLMERVRNELFRGIVAALLPLTMEGA